MKHILENKNCVSVECFKMEIIEPIIISIIRFVFFLRILSCSSGSSELLLGGPISPVFLSYKHLGTMQA